MPSLRRSVAVGLRRFATAPASAELVRQLLVGLGALRIGPVEGDRQAVARCLRQPDAAGDDRLEHGVVEVMLHLGRDLARQVRPGVEHREQHARDLELGMEMVADQVHRREELRQALERVVLALDRDEDRVRGRQRVDREQAERRRAVDEDPVPGVGLGPDRAGQPALAPLHVRELHLGAGELDRGRDQAQPVDGGAHVERSERAIADEDVIGGTVDAHSDPRQSRSWRCPGDRDR